MFRPLIPVLLTSALTAIGGTAAQAEGVIDDIELSALFESEVAISTVTGDTQKVEIVLTPEIGLDLTRSTRLTLIGRLRGNLVDELEPGKPGQRNRSTFSKRLFVDDNIDIELREAYIDTDIGSTFLRVGINIGFAMFEQRALRRGR